MLVSKHKERKYEAEAVCCKVHSAVELVCVLLQSGSTPKELAQRAGHMTIVRLLSGPDTYQQNLDAGLGGAVRIAILSWYSVDGSPACVNAKVGICESVEYTCKVVISIAFLSCNTFFR